LLQDEAASRAPEIFERAHPELPGHKGGMMVKRLFRSSAGEDRAKPKVRWGPAPPLLLPGNLHCCERALLLRAADLGIAGLDVACGADGSGRTCARSGRWT
jgi:hypothetical protein